jgi:hypothetical protein
MLTIGTISKRSIVKLIRKPVNIVKIPVKNNVFIDKIDYFYTGGTIYINAIFNAKKISICLVLGYFTVPRYLTLGIRKTLMGRRQWGIRWTY